MAEDQGTGTPPESQASEPVVNMPDGSSVPVSQAVGKWNDMLKGMNEAQRQAADYEKELASYREWADPIKERYNAGPDEQRAFNEWWQGQQGTAEPTYQPQGSDPLDPVNQRLRDLETRDRDRDFKDQLREVDQWARSQGLELDDEKQGQLLRHIHRTDLPALAAAKDLFFDDVVRLNRDQSVKQTADKLNRGQRAYPKTEAGYTPPSPKDVKSMSREEKKDAVLDRLRDSWDAITGG
jgi:hypothetical protein